jgi:hypothetical protein
MECGINGFGNDVGFGRGKAIPELEMSLMEEVKRVVAAFRKLIECMNLMGFSLKAKRRVILWASVGV